MYLPFYRHQLRDKATGSASELVTAFLWLKTLPKFYFAVYCAHPLRIALVLGHLSAYALLARVSLLVSGTTASYIAGFSTRSGWLCLPPWWLAPIGLCAKFQNIVMNTMWDNIPINIDIHWYNVHRYSLYHALQPPDGSQGIPYVWHTNLHHAD